jgi:hypothetical protein
MPRGRLENQRIQERMCEQVLAKAGQSHGIRELAEFTSECRSEFITDFTPSSRRFRLRETLYLLILSESPVSRQQTIRFLLSVHGVD